MRIRLKIAKKCGWYLDIFSCVKMSVFRSFFAFKLEMHVRCDNQYKTGANGENILGQPMLFECMSICVLSPVWSCFLFIRSGQNHLERHSEIGKKTRQTEEDVGRQHQ